MREDRDFEFSYSSHKEELRRINPGYVVLSPRWGVWHGCWRWSTSISKSWISCLQEMNWCQEDTLLVILAGHPLLSFTIYSPSERSAELGDWLQGFGIFKRGTDNHITALENLNYMIWQQSDYFGAGGLKIENLFQKFTKELSALDVFMQWLRRQSIQCFSFSNSSHGASEFVDIEKRRALVSSSFGRGDVRVRILVCFIQGFGEV